MTTTTTLNPPAVLVRVAARPPAQPAWRQWLGKLQARLVRRPRRPPPLRLVVPSTVAELDSEAALDWAMHAGAEAGMGAPPDLRGDLRYAYEVGKRHRETML
jgi:hypothetical protein